MAIVDVMANISPIYLNHHVSDGSFQYCTSRMRHFVIKSTYLSSIILAQMLEPPSGLNPMCMCRRACARDCAQRSRDLAAQLGVVALSLVCSEFVGVAKLCGNMVVIASRRRGL
jgi:hypothetical protein